MKNRFLTNHRNISIIQLLTYLVTLLPETLCGPFQVYCPTLEGRKSCFKERKPMEHGAEERTAGIRKCACMEEKFMEHSP